MFVRNETKVYYAGFLEMHTLFCTRYVVHKIFENSMCIYFFHQIENSRSQVFSPSHIAWYLFYLKGQNIERTGEMCC